MNIFDWLFDLIGNVINFILGILDVLFGWLWIF